MLNKKYVLGILGCFICKFATAALLPAGDRAGNYITTKSLRTSPCTAPLSPGHFAKLLTNIALNFSQNSGRTFIVSIRFLPNSQPRQIQLITSQIAQTGFELIGADRHLELNFKVVASTNSYVSFSEILAEFQPILESLNYAVDDI